MTLLQLNNLGVQTASNGTRRYVLADINLAVEAGQILAIVGPSGAGKTSLGRAIIGLLDLPEATVSGTIIFQGQDLTNLDQGDLQKLRGRKIASIFQDSEAALNPVQSIGTQLVQVVRQTQRVGRRSFSFLSASAFRWDAATGCNSIGLRWAP
jgi:ABC-type glutathione transport system ATPase component